MFVTATVVVFTLKGGVLVTPDPSPSPPALNEVPEQLLVARTTARSPPSSRASAPPPASPAQPLLPLGLHVDLQLAPAGALDWAKLPLSVNYTLRSVIYNPALAMVDGRLHLFARHEGRHLSNEWRDCPTTSLHAPARACPVPSLRMVSFLVTAELDPASLQPMSVCVVVCVCVGVCVCLNSSKTEHHCSQRWSLKTTSSDIPPPISGKLREYEYPLDYTRAQRSVHHRELGPEDPRAFHWAEAAKDAAANVYVAYNGPPLGDKQVPSMLRSMKIQRILPAPPGPVVELYSKELQLGRYEKNWAPIMPSQDGLCRVEGRRELLLEPIWTNARMAFCFRNSELSELSSNFHGQARNSFSAGCSTPTRSLAAGATASASLLPSLAE